jgi:hypothetical protein
MTRAAAELAAALRSGEIEVTRLAEGSGVVLHLATLRSRTLNPSAMSLLDAVAAGAGSIAALAGRLVAEHGIDEATAASDAAAFLDALGALLTVAD